MNSYPSFNALADKISEKKQFHDIITKQQRFFQINPYKIEKLYSEAAKKIYAQILAKYEITNEFQISENVWQQNQRRVFVWYIILLIELYAINPQKSTQIKWNQLSQIFFFKNPQFLEFQFANILKSKNKIIWSQEEDRILLQAMSKEKTGKWNQVSKRIFYQSVGLLFKSPKHCRQRWFNHLDQSKNKGSWTLQEDYTVFKFIIENGKRWACIVKQLQNSRTQHMIKNRYNSLISKVKKNRKKREQQVAQMVFKTLEAQVKSQRREKKTKQQELNSKHKKLESLENKNQLQQNVQKSLILQEPKSENSTSKNLEIKIEEEIRNQQPIYSQMAISEKNSQQCLPDLNSMQNQTLFGCQMIAINPYQFFYYCQPSAFQVNPYFAF